MDEETILQPSLKQRLIALAQSEHAAVIPELLKMASQKTPLVGDTSHATVVNAVTIETQQKLITDVMVLINDIRMGKLNETNF